MGTLHTDNVHRTHVKSRHKTNSNILVVVCNVMQCSTKPTYLSVQALISRGKNASLTMGGAVRRL